MQCLARTSPIADPLLKGTANLCPNGTFASHNNNVTKAATRVVHSILYASSSDANQSITALKTALGNENADFATGGQQDVQELFSFLIDKLHEDQNHSTANPDDDDEGIYAGSSPVNDAVSCKRVLETTCTCGATSVQQDPMSIIQIALPSETRTSLEECVDSHFMDVVLSDDNSFECSICKKKTEATQRLSLAELPPIIPIHLVRFSADGRSKNNTHVDIPEELDLSEYRVQGNDDTETPAVYRRYAVIKHIGGVGGGHYVAYVKGRDGIWRLFDDDKPPQVVSSRGRGLDRTLSDGAYMVFYAREDVDLNALDASEVVPLADLPEVVFPPLPNEDDEVPAPPSSSESEDTNVDQDDNSTIQSLLQQARAHLDAGRVGEALKLYQDTLKSLSVENADVYRSQLVNGIVRCLIDSTDAGKKLATDDLSSLRDLLEEFVTQPINNESIACSHHLLAFVDKLYLNILARSEVTREVVTCMMLLMKEIESINHKFQMSRVNVDQTRKSSCKKYADAARRIAEDAMSNFLEEEETDDDVSDPTWNGEGEHSEDDADSDWEEEEEETTRKTRSTSNKRKKPSSEKKKSAKKTA